MNRLDIGRVSIRLKGVSPRRSRALAARLSASLQAELAKRAVRPQGADAYIQELDIGTLRVRGALSSADLSSEVASTISDAVATATAKGARPE